MYVVRVSIKMKKVKDPARTVITASILMQKGDKQIAIIVQQARLPTVSVKLVSILVVIVVKENTLQRAVDFALNVMLESGQTQRQLLLVRHARIVRQTLIQMQGAKLKGPATATKALLARMGVSAQVARQANTRRRWEAGSAQIVQPESLPHPLGQRQILVATAP